jgi:hypothetical protein
VQIPGKRGNAVLISEGDWRAIHETLYLVSIPGMRESILDCMATDVSELERSVYQASPDASIFSTGLSTKFSSRSAS